MSDALKKIIEGIDARDVSMISENFTAAIREKVMTKIVSESEKAFDKGVEEIEGDGDSEADGQDQDEDGKKKADEDK